MLQKHSSIHQKLSENIEQFNINLKSELNKMLVKKKYVYLCLLLFLQIIYYYTTRLALKFNKKFKLCKMNRIKLFIYKDVKVSLFLEKTKIILKLPKFEFGEG